MAQLLIEVTSFNPILRESKERPGVYEVEGVMQRATAKNQNGRTYSKAILERETKKYISEFVSNGNALPFETNSEIYFLVSLSKIALL